MKKKLDSRIKCLLETSYQNNHRSLFVIVGDRGKNQVANLHYLLSKLTNKTKPSVLWCYKKDLGFSSHRKKRMKQIKKLAQRGLLDVSRDDPFEIFVSSTNIRYTYYSETHKILGNTFGMCVLQDFEALTPNTLARTVETVEGGGLIVLLLGSLQSLKQLYTMAMDVHDRFRTEAHQDVVARFNERFILSLCRCQACLIMDDELNVLPLSSPVKNGAFSLSSEQQQAILRNKEEWLELKSSVENTAIIGELVNKTKTVDQAKALLTFIESISDKTLRSTIALTAARGRGKSAALGLAVAAAVAYQYSNIFVTCPSPENLKSFFDFVFVGFDVLQYKEHIDYEILQSTEASLKDCIVRINVFRSHRQTIQYIDPRDASKVLHQAELLVIDEAAAIPLPIVKNMLGPYLIFLSSTITGYEGTGRSLSLKLFDQLRNISAGKTGGYKDNPYYTAANGMGRIFREITLETPIRYSLGDPIEGWLYNVLCLEAGKGPLPLIYGCPHPNECQLYMVNRDALFSGQSLAESFLQKIMALFVASHYKNSPNDLQMLSDAPAHRLFVLLAPMKAHQQQQSLPDILCAIQVCFEGQISTESVQQSMARGYRAAGDLIPWTISQQFQDSQFASLSGVRIVRIATHPDVQRMGYGSRALQLLCDYYSGKMISLEDNSQQAKQMELGKGSEEEINLYSEHLEPRKNLPPLLGPLRECEEKIDYVGVSFGLTHELFGFWKKQGFLPLYIRLTPNDLTGEHTCIMLKSLPSDQLSSWLLVLFEDFKRRFLSLLSYEWKNWNPSLTLQVIDYGCSISKSNLLMLDASHLHLLFTSFDIQRLEAYARNLIDYHMILDLLPMIARLYFSGQMGNSIHLSAAQSAILVSIGLQHMHLDQLEKLLNVPSQQLLALLNKMIRKFANLLKELETQAIASEQVPEQQVSLDTGEKDIQSNETIHNNNHYEDQWKEALEEISSSAQQHPPNIISIGKTYSPSLKHKKKKHSLDAYSKKHKSHH
eukprot:jgi/Galph1/2870/GphlegSOOS_G1524.1